MDAIAEIKSRDLKKYLENKGFEFRKNMTLCPFHKDSNPSLAVNNKNGSYVWYCHSCEEGGSVIDFVMKQEGISKGDAIKKLKEYYHIENEKPKIVKKYPYKRDGKTQYVINRFSPKDFRADRKMTGIERIPYHYDDVIKASTVWLVEGEKDSDTIRKLGITATTFPFGKNHWQPEFAKYFKGKTVFICLDKGAEKEAEKRAKDLIKTVRLVKVIELPELTEEGQDISNWIEFHDSKTNEELKERLQAIAEKTPVYEPVENGIRITNSFLRKYIDSVSSVTDAPELFILFSGLGLLSGVLNKFYFKYPRKTCLNLYILLLAPSTYYRKSVTVDIAADYLFSINPELLFPESFTPEALLEILSKQNRGLLRWSELIQVKEFQFGSDYNRGLPSLLTDLFDFKEKVKRWTKGGKVEINEPIISILAAGISSWLVQNLNQLDFQGGIWTRFIFVPVPEEERKFKLPKEFILDIEIQDKLKELDSLDGRKMDLSRVLPLMESWGKRHMKQTLQLQNDILQANFQRLEIMLLKTSCLLQLAENGSTTIEPETFQEAVRIIEYLKRVLPVFFEEEIKFTEVDKAKARVRKILKIKRNLKKTEILRRANINTDLAKKVLDQLVEEGEIKPISIKPTSKGGRPGVLYKFIGE
jgi:hypothetical protein